jgi:hypothetical protein
VFENRVLRRILGHRRNKWWEAGEDFIMWSFITCTIHQYYHGEHVEEDGMGGACSTHGRDEKCIQYFGWKT